jgi:transcriptional regulator with XRE-family HTH domain
MKSNAPRFSRRQQLAAARRIAGQTLAEIAAAFGVTPQAISKRLKQFEANLTPEQLRRYQRACRHRYGKALASNGRRLRMRRLTT